ncbi:MAG: hypothetical protein KGI00_04970 [Candidatus Micrarchaeota archaeon]|nr:hypothetical protein [Candidatus Micrarchaeota archaeon]
MANAYGLPSVDMYGIPSGDVTIGGGFGYLPYYDASQKNLNDLYKTQGSLGENLLSELTKLRLDPTAGPAALAAFNQYGGGAQNIAQGTGGVGVPFKEQSLYDQLIQGLGQGIMNPGSPFNPANKGQFNLEAAPYTKPDANNAPAPTPQKAAEAPNNAQALIDAYKAYHGGQTPPGLAGGGVVFAGKPHWIINDNGVPMAEITEDGKPEQVNGIGGVEVTPLDPARKLAYEHGKLLADMEARVSPPPVKAATGTNMLFPQMPGSTVNTRVGAPSATAELPTYGGTSVSREEQVAATNPFKETGVKDSGTFEMPTGPNDIARYAKLLGGALSAGNTLVNVDALKELNAGKMPSQLLSSTELSSMLPSQQAGYLAMLQQAGLGNVNDLKAQIKAGTPVALHSAVG